jgi:hypothetical protein
MNTYTALISAKVGNTSRMVKTEIKAASAAEAKWLLQAIYGFHAISASPTEVREDLTVENLSQPSTPEQQRITSLKAAKDRASDALKAERDRQKRNDALKSLQRLSSSIQSH